MAAEPAAADYRGGVCGNIKAQAELKDADAFDLMSAMAEKSPPGAGGGPSPRR